MAVAERARLLHLHPRGPKVPTPDEEIIVSIECNHTSQETNPSDPGGGVVPYPTTPNEEPKREHHKSGEQPDPQEPAPQPIHPPLPDEPIHPELPGKPAVPAVLGVLALFMGSLSLSGCAVIGDIFKAGVWVGIFVVVGLVALVVGGMSLMRR